MNSIMKVGKRNQVKPLGRRYNLSKLISESYQTLYECPLDSKLYKLTESHIASIQNHPDKISLHSQNLEILKGLVKLGESADIEDSDIPAVDEVEDADIVEEDDEVDMEDEEVIEEDDGEVEATDDEALDEIGIGGIAHQAGVVKGAIGATAAGLAANAIYNAGKKSNESVSEDEDTIEEDEDIEVEDTESIDSEDLDIPEEDIEENEDTDTEITPEELSELKKHLKEIRKARKTRESAECEDCEDEEVATDVKESRTWKSEKSTMTRALKNFRESSNKKAFYKSFNKLQERMRSPKPLTVNEAILLYKASNSAMTHLTVELEHNPEFIYTFRECTRILSADNNKLLECIRKQVSPSKSLVESYRNFSSILLESDDIEDDIVEEDEDIVLNNEETEDIDELGPVAGAAVGALATAGATALSKLKKAEVHTGNGGGASVEIGDSEEANPADDEELHEEDDVDEIPAPEEEVVEDTEEVSEDPVSTEDEEVIEEDDEDLDSEITDEEAEELKKKLMELRKSRKK